MICGSLCDSCAVQGEANIEKDKHIEQILFKEVYEREKVSKLIDKEILNLKEHVNVSLSNIKGYCDKEKETLDKLVEVNQINSNISISKIENDIERIHDKHLQHIETDISRINTYITTLSDDLKIIKNNLRDMNKMVIKNTTQLEIIISQK